LEASWIALYVDTSQPLSPDAKERLARNLALARELGGSVLTIASDNISEAMLRLARQRNVTQIVVGKPQSSLWQRLLRGGSLVDKLVRTSGDIDIYVVTGDKPQSTSQPRFSFSQPEQSSNLKQYALALLIVGLVTAADWVILQLFPWIGYQAVGLTELMAVLLIAVYIGRGPALLAAAASAISWNFLFIQPRFTFEISHLQDVFLLILYFVIALFTGSLTSRIRMQERQARYNAERNMALYTLAHETATAVDMAEVLRTAVAQIAGVFDAEIAILLSQGEMLRNQPHGCSTLQVDDKDFSVALWVFDNRKPAGRFTNTLPLASATYLPLLTPSRAVGVMGIRPRQKERLSFDQEVLLETFTSQIALVIERELLDEAAEQSAMLRESERLYATLLNSISHELRTPIAAITGAASSLLNSQTDLRENARLELTRNIQEAADRLNRLVENLLDMSRLESGRLNLKREWCDIGDIIGVAVQHRKSCFASRPIYIHTAPDLPLVQMDFGLIEQVFINLLDNICNYTPLGTQVKIQAHASDRWLEITVEDNGPGIPESSLDSIFEKFFRVPGTATGGTGLGLSISRGLIEAHGGTLTATNIPEGGLRFTIRLPAHDTPPPVQEASL
jgi:two-component system, OmpR family, sensor histidine kinase KdpD